MGSINPLVTPKTKPAAAASGNFFKPGLHTHNFKRRSAQRSEIGRLRYLQIGLMVIGCLGLGYYLYSLSDQYIYQAYQNWAFDQQIAGRTEVAFTDYVRQQTPFAFLVGGKSVAPAIPSPKSAVTNVEPRQTPALITGALMGRVSIDRLHLSAMVREGVDAGTLSKAVGHVPTTALPGNPGNFAIAAHRDTLFRALKDIQTGDLVKFQSTGGTYTYQVLATKIVQPSDVSVLRADGGGLIQEPAGRPEGDRLLTMITCYPFYYVGSAPKRFIVEGRLVSTDTQSVLSVKDGGVQAGDRPPPPVRRPIKRISHTPLKHQAARQAISKEPRHVQGSSRFSAANNEKPKKRGFWHRLFRG